MQIEELYPLFSSLLKLHRSVEAQFSRCETLAQLEIDFTQFRMICSGDIQQMKDKMTQQNNLLKLQKQLTGEVSTELSSHLTSFQDIFSQQTILIKKLQQENQSLQKAQAKLLAKKSLTRATR